MVGYLDAIFVPLSLFLMAGYHAYLWHRLKKNPSCTTIGINSQRRRMLFLEIMKGGDSKGMLAVQSMRNTQMVSIFNASIAILLNTALAALTNNSYNASLFLNTTVFFGSKSKEIFALKYGSASFILLSSFFCSSLALAFFMDATFLLTALSFEYSSSFRFSKTVLERGNLLALIGNRLLWVTFPLLLWMFGPLPVILSSSALVWWLYELDFPSIKSHKQSHI